MALQKHFDFGGATHHSGGSKSAAKKTLHAFWDYILGQSGSLPEQLTVGDLAPFQKSIKNHGDKLINSYRVSGGAFVTPVQDYIEASTQFLDQFTLDGDDQPVSADTQLDLSKRDLMLQFEHHVNGLIRQYETVISHYHPE
ncbi:hypothetical protein AYR62_06290 [Secundilactobacillus paracollinoides]|uniref:Uncharacterized protein n=1 Tax=Secundilactobacillus paracollinoides TaxID=240427 RepID=A0A1B2J171_9LACO|nr:hypothetical protein [Secundilactobacillus paracollinoides]ANZ62055.1 hypothetical protein AYR61_12305 [Secundilactobacillus paracollinoides]ANZ63740.1 hypothetical protein AYR62_06290 [Secundilactobacillus paracollinoides]ANZ68000.1 hypothetical protein AYR63_13195 [Secundilactobacillus paracollinoides]KRL76540.1 hypothetical protein FC17_GL002045 [Secundilactobacillus paracollinoides DSM 15502 = JCM 11969]